MRQRVSALLLKAFLRVGDGWFLYKRITFDFDYLFTFIQNALALEGPQNPPNGSKSSLMALVGFQCPLRGEKNLLSEHEN